MALYPKPARVGNMKAIFPSDAGILENDTRLEKRLRAEIADLRRALRVFADLAGGWESYPNDWHVTVELKFCRVAAEILGPDK